MKVAMYNTQKEEKSYALDYASNRGLDIDVFLDSFSITHLRQQPQVYDALIVSGFCFLDDKCMMELKKYGIHCIVTRSAGYDKLDVEAARKQGIDVANVPSYAPNAVSEFTLALVLASVRNLKPLQKRSEQYVFSKNGLQTREIRNMRVGIIGTGRIGFEVIKHFSGFTNDIVAYDVFENTEVTKYAQYVGIDTLYQSSDIICLHVPLSEDNYHMINEKVLNTMKDGVIIVNTSRGALIDTKALLKAINTGKVSRAALDVYEFESKFYKKKTPIKDSLLTSMIENDRIILTPHIAFYTQEAVRNLVVYAIDNVVTFQKEGKTKYSLCT
ncbi:MAG: NAD(P)-dependent oxidoreductase [Breznakia sp.]